MKLKRIQLFSSIVVLFIASCTNEINYQFEEKQIHSEGRKECEVDQCPLIIIDYFEVLLPITLRDRVQVETVSVFKGQLMPEGQEASSLEQAITQYITNSRNAYPESTAFSNGFEFLASSTPSYFSNHLFSMKLETYEFAGGAHGNSQTLYKNYNPENGELLSIPDLIAHMPSFLAFVEAAFKSNFEIKQGSSINSTGFWFENETFSLPENIGFTIDGMVLIYNAYEIAPYASGSQELLLPWQEVADFLKVD